MILPARLFQTGVRLPQTAKLGGTEEKPKLDGGCEGRGVIVGETFNVREDRRKGPILQGYTGRVMNYVVSERGGKARRIRERT